MSMEFKILVANIPSTRRKTKSKKGSRLGRMNKTGRKQAEARCKRFLNPSALLDYLRNVYFFALLYLTIKD